MKSVAKEKGLHVSHLENWIKFYQKYGESGLVPRVNQSYTVDFKLHVVQTIQKDHLSLIEARLRFNIPTDSILVKWQRDYQKQGIKGLENKPRGRPSIMDIKRKKRKSDKPLTREEELLLEIEGLRAENALLKKLQALIQAEENKKRKP